jgi:Flp pilus assembly protein CpaB
MNVVKGAVIVLHRALPVQKRGGACLELDVPRVDDVALDVARAIAKGRLRLALRGAEEAQEVLGALREAHAAAAAARRRLDHDREADLVGHLRMAQRGCTGKLDRIILNGPRGASRPPSPAAR